LLLANLVLLLQLALIAELCLRFYIRYNPGYYTSVSRSPRELVYAYGRIPINAAGFPDREFELRQSYRIGYFGDSVAYGVGAGYPHRISDLLRVAYPDRDHLTLAGMGLSISAQRIAHCARLARQYSLDEAVYLLNLNDILPDEAARGEQKATVRSLQGHVYSRLDWLRGRSYLYSFFRHIATSFMDAHGIGFHGYAAYELYPHRHADILRQTAARIDRFNRALDEAGARLTVVVLPYEMQISGEAEARYRALGVQWEDGFIERGPQRVLLEYLPRDVRVVDAYYAFGEDDSPATWRARHRIGQYFVYNLGDKLDWNHPNRAGHRAIAQYLIKTGVFATEASPTHSERR
jgi:hypothetical protein